MVVEGIVDIANRKEKVFALEGFRGSTKKIDGCVRPSQALERES